MAIVRVAIAPSADRPVRPLPGIPLHDQLLVGLIAALLLLEFSVPRFDPLVGAIGAFAIYAAVLVAYPAEATFGTWRSKAARALRGLIRETRP